MIPVNEAFKKAYMTGAQKYITLQFSDGTTLTGSGVGSPINEGSMALEQVLCDEEQLHFGRCNSASFSISILATPKRYKGLFVTPTISSGGYSQQLGKFRIDSDVLTDDGLYRSLTSYDQMTDLLTDDVSGWYADLPIGGSGNQEITMTLKQFRNSLFSYFQDKYGVKQAALKIQGVPVDSLPNDDMIVRRTIDSYNPIDGQEVLERICELNGCFGVINEDGDFEYRFLQYDEQLYPANDLFPADDLYPIGLSEVLGGDPDDPETGIIQSTLTWQEYEYQPITKLQIHQTENDIGAIVGTNGNAYEVYDNFLVYGMLPEELETVATNLLNVLKKTISYTPIRVSVRGRPWIQTGDLLGLLYKGRIYQFPVLRRSMTGITALKDEYEAQGQEYFSFDVMDTNHEIYSILRRTYEITKDVNGLTAIATETDYDFRTFTSTLWQRAKEIGVDVSNGLNHATLVALINDVGESQVQISAQNIELNGYVTFHALETAGETVINGSNITTGTINASLIKTGILKASSGFVELNLQTGELFVKTINLLTTTSRDRYICSLKGGGYGLEFYENRDPSKMYSYVAAGGVFAWSTNASVMIKASDTPPRNHPAMVSVHQNEAAIEGDLITISGKQFHADNTIDLYAKELIVTDSEDRTGTGQSRTCWVSNSNGNPASFTFVNGILVETTGF